jgi:hypothetical protein
MSGGGEAARIFWVTPPLCRARFSLSGKGRGGDPLVLSDFSKSRFEWICVTRITQTPPSFRYYAEQHRGDRQCPLVAPLPGPDLGSCLCTAASSRLGCHGIQWSAKSTLGIPQPQESPAMLSPTQGFLQNQQQFLGVCICCALCWTLWSILHEA